MVLRGDHLHEWKVADLLQVADADERLGRMMARLIVLTYVGFLLLASFYPFQPRFNRSFLYAQWLDFLNTPNIYWLHPTWPRIIHMIANLFFYFPWGFVVPFATVRIGTRGSVAPSLWAPFYGIFLSLPIELLQIGWVNRKPDLVDALMNALGYGVGYWLARVLIRRHRAGPEIFIGWPNHPPLCRLARTTGILYLVLIVLLFLLPFEPQWDRHVIVAKLHNVAWLPSHIWLNPWAPWPLERSLGVFSVALAFIPLGFLALVANPRWTLKPKVLAVAAGAVMTLILEILRIPILERTCDLVQVAAAVVGMVAGVLLAHGWLQKNTIL